MVKAHTRTVFHIQGIRLCQNSNVNIDEAVCAIKEAVWNAVRHVVHDGWITRGECTMEAKSQANNVTFTINFPIIHRHDVPAVHVSLRPSMY